MTAKNEVTKGIERILQVEKETKRGLAKRLGVSETQAHNYFGNDIYVSSLLKILDALDYEILFRPKTGMGQVNVIDRDYDPCANCPDKIFATTVCDAMDNLRVHATEVGTEIDFYS